MWFFRPIRFEECRSVYTFVFLLSLQLFAVKGAAGFLMFGFESNVPDLREYAAEWNEQAQPRSGSNFDVLREYVVRNPVRSIFSCLFLAPVLETLVFQCGPIELFRRCRQSRWRQFLAGMLLFAAVHFVGGFQIGVAAGVTCGVFFSHTYLECRILSWQFATTVTGLTHALHNLVALSVTFLT